MSRISRRSFLSQSAVAASSIAFPNVIGLGQSDYDTVILGGTVIDPETGLNAVRNVGIRGKTIAAVTSKSIKGKRTIPAKGLTVTPGFIDPISHGQNMRNDLVQVFDGVTTKLQMENGVEDQDAWHKEQKGNRLCNYGAGCGHSHAREKFITGVPDYNVAVANDIQIAKMANYLDKELSKGALGMGFGLEYNPASTRWEVLEMFRVAGKHKVSCHVHTRYGTLLEEQSNLTAIQEIMSCAMATGANAHIVHVPSMALGNTEKALTFIERAQARGFDITCDFYPYGAFGTGLASEVFAPGWQEKFGMTYKDLEWAKTHERLTEETFNKYREEGGFVIAHCIPESAVRLAVQSKNCMVGSDGSLREGGVGHPRSSGTFCRVLGKYCRDEKLIPLPLAIKKMTILAAKRFEARCPAFKKKGRIQVGADADIAVFDFAKVIDRSTYDEPAKTSEGMVWVLVNGVPVLANGSIASGRHPGTGLRA